MKGISMTGGAELPRWQQVPCACRCFWSIFRDRVGSLAEGREGWLSLPGFPLHFAIPSLGKNPVFWFPGDSHHKSSELKSLGTDQDTKPRRGRPMPAPPQAAACLRPASPGTPQCSVSFLPFLAGPKGTVCAGREAVGKARAIKHIALNNVKKGKIIKM